MMKTHAYQENGFPSKIAESSPNEVGGDDAAKNVAHLLTLLDVF